MEKVNENVVEGTFVSEWDGGDIETNGTINTKTLEVECESYDGDVDYNYLINEKFITINGDEYDICMECHEHALNENDECSYCD